MAWLPLATAGAFHRSDPPDREGSFELVDAVAEPVAAVPGFGELFAGFVAFVGERVDALAEPVCTVAGQRSRKPRM